MVILGFAFAGIALFAGQPALAAIIAVAVCVCQDVGERNYAQRQIDERHKAIARARIDN